MVSHHPPVAPYVPARYTALHQRRFKSSLIVLVASLPVCRAVGNRLVYFLPPQAYVPACRAYPRVLALSTLLTAICITLTLDPSPMVLSGYYGLS